MRLATLHQDGWELESGVARHRASPTTFWIPGEIERANVRPGKAVKLLFLIEMEEADADTDVQVERMWVLVTERAGRHYRGFLDSEPVVAGSLAVGQEVCFAPEHIIDIGDPSRDYYEERIRQFTTKSG